MHISVIIVSEGNVEWQVGLYHSHNPVRKHQWNSSPTPGRPGELTRSSPAALHLWTKGKTRRETDTNCFTKTLKYGHVRIDQSTL